MAAVPTTTLLIAFALSSSGQPSVRLVAPVWQPGRAAALMHASHISVQYKINFSPNAADPWVVILWAGDEIIANASDHGGITMRSSPKAGFVQLTVRATECGADGIRETVLSIPYYQETVLIDESEAELRIRSNGTLTCTPAAPSDPAAEALSCLARGDGLVGGAEREFVVARPQADDAADAISAWLDLAPVEALRLLRFVRAHFPPPARAAAPPPTARRWVVLPCADDAAAAAYLVAVATAWSKIVGGPRLFF